MKPHPYIHHYSTPRRSIYSKHALTIIGLITASGLIMSGVIAIAYNLIWK